MGGITLSQVGDQFPQPWKGGCGWFVGDKVGFQRRILLDASDEGIQFRALFRAVERGWSQ